MERVCDKMEIVCIPSFIHSASHIKILRQLEAITNLSLKFASKVGNGKDISVDIMKELLKFKPIQGFPEVTSMVNLLKDVILGFQYNRMNGNGPDLPTPPKKATKAPRHSLFSKDLLDIAKDHLVTLQSDIFDHKKVMKTLKKVQKDYIVELKKFKQLENEHNGASGKLTEMTEGGRSNRLMIWIKEKRVQRLEKCLDKQREKTSRYLEDLNRIMDVEKDVRLGRLKESETVLENELQFRLLEGLCSGYDGLLRFAAEFNLPHNVTENLREFNVMTLAKSVYRKLCAKYIFPTIKDSALDTPISSCRFENPHDVVLRQNKHVSKSESSLELLSESENSICKTREDLYVRSCITRSQTTARTMMKFSSGQKIKQKCCSHDGEVAFGWKRMLPVGPKVYGFYPTQSVVVLAT